MMKASAEYPYDSSTWPSVAKTLHEILDGYVAVADPPLSVLYPELLKLYPDAKVIVTVRDREPWMRSMAEVIKLSQPKLATFIFWWVPSVRWLPKLAEHMTHLFYTKFGVEMKDRETFITTWNKHIEQLEKTVPEGQLFFFDVKEGWEPLCKVSPFAGKNVTAPSRLTMGFVRLWTNLYRMSHFLDSMMQRTWKTTSRNWPREA